MVCAADMFPVDESFIARRVLRGLATNKHNLLIGECCGGSNFGAEVSLHRQSRRLSVPGFLTFFAEPPRQPRSGSDRKVKFNTAGFVGAGRDMSI
jgi:hypothetical protein